MATRTWQLNIDGKPYQIILNHGAFTGKREIWVNGESVMKARITIDGGSEHHFEVGTHPAEIGIVGTLSWKYEYYLLVDDQLQFALEEKKQTVGKRTKAKLDERAKWQNMGRTFGLEYHPLEIKQFIYQHRLLGFYRNFLVQIQPGFFHGQANTPGVLVLIRHFDLDEDKIKTIKKDKQVEAFLREIKFPPGLEIYRNTTMLFIRILNKKGEQKLEKTIEKFLALFLQFIQPRSPEKCEVPQCKQPVGEELHLTVINNLPHLMCKSCIAEIDVKAQKMKEEYQQAPSGLFKGLVFSVGGAMLGAIIGALAMTFLERIGAVFIIAIPFFVILFMLKAGTKRTGTSMLLANLIAWGGFYFGWYLTRLGILLKENKLDLSLERLLRIATQIFSDREFFGLSILMGLFLTLPFSFMAWNASRRYLKRLFAPEVEVITAFRQLPFKPG